MYCHHFFMVDIKRDAKIPWEYLAKNRGLSTFAETLTTTYDNQD